MVGGAWSGGVHGPGGCMVPGGVHGPGGCMVLGGPWSGGGVGIPALRQTPPGETATAADGTHPTGMHSCLILKYI